MKQFRNKMKWKEEGGENPLLSNDALFNAAMDEFSLKAFNEASLNDILRFAPMNKGSFYYRFYDKMDLYLSLFHRLGMLKLQFFANNKDKLDMSCNIFNRIRVMVKLGILFARQEGRYYDLWRRYSAEDRHIHEIVMSNFDDMSFEYIGEMVVSSRQRGEISDEFPDDFLVSTLRLLLLNLDKIADPNAGDEHLIAQADRLAGFLEKGMGVK